MTVPFTDIDKKYGFPEGLLASMWKQESGCGKNMLSPVGARGHFQFMPGTRPEVMAETGLDPWSNDPRIAAECAAHYLKKQSKYHGGDLAKALASYNAGAGNVDKAVKRAGSDWLSSLTSETRNYVPQILQRIGMADRIDFTNRYTHGQVTDTQEIERERKKRREILLDVMGTSKEKVDKMNDEELFGSSFLGMVASFVKALMEIFSSSKEANQTLTVEQPQTPKVAFSRVASVGISS